MREQEHRYEVEKISNGFRVIPRDDKKDIIIVTLDGDGFWHKDNDHYSEFAAFGFYKLIDSIVDDLARDYKFKNLRFVPKKVMKWYKGHVGRTLNHEIHNAWSEAINKLDNTTYKLHKRFFSIYPKLDRIQKETIKSIIDDKNPLIVSDILNYRAAAIAFIHTQDLQQTKNDWMLSYSFDGTKYRALTRTLMNLSGAIPTWAIWNSLSATILPEAIITRMRMLAYTSLIPKLSWARLGRDTDRDLTVILKSSDEDIKNSILYMWRYFPDKTSGDFRSTRSIYSALDRIFDYGGSWNNIDILGLCKRSVEYHRNEQLRQRIQAEQLELRRARWEEETREAREKRKKELEELECSRTAIPKIDLPNDKHIHLLDTYKVVQEEGQTMHHCIASYAEKAVKGGCYLFHVNYHGEDASVEVLPTGIVSQSYGPHDKTNQASEYGRMVLSRWAKQLVTQ